MRIAKAAKGNHGIIVSLLPANHSNPKPRLQAGKDHSTPDVIANVVFAESGNNERECRGEKDAFAAGCVRAARAGNQHRNRVDRSLDSVR